MKAVTSYEMGVLEQKAIQHYGIPALILMENAAIGFVNALCEQRGDADKYLIFCGRGNNGGDGFAIARHLYNAGAEVRVVMLGAPEESKPDAYTNYQIARAMGIPIYDFTNAADRPKIDAHLMMTDIVIDAMIGTGFRGELKETAAQAAACINRSGKYVAAVDMPSGVNSDTGHIAEPCVQADLTVTFALPKVGQLIYPGRAQCGTVVVAPISIPAAVIEESAAMNHLLEEGYARTVLPLRAAQSHKGTFGKAFVLAGSMGMTGAAVLCTRSLLKAGAGMVTLGLPDCIWETAASQLTEAMTCPLPSLNGALSKTALPMVQEKMKACDVLLMGCGISLNDSTAYVMRKLLEDNPIPLVIDADGINALADNLIALSARGADVVLTPHPAEFARMTGVEPEVVQANRVDIARKFALDFKVSLVLKGADTVVAHPDGEVYINTRGNSGMATAGSGDVLAGVIAGLIAQGLSVKQAANLGVYLHAVAGDIAAGQYGEYALNALNIIECIGGAIGTLTDEAAQPV